MSTNNEEKAPVTEVIRIYGKDEHGDTRTFEVPSDTDLNEQAELKKFIRSASGISIKGAILSSLKKRPVPTD